MDINSKLNKKGRTLCLGDSHGGYKALLQVLERCNFDKNIIFIPAVIDSLGVMN